MQKRYFAHFKNLKNNITLKIFFLLVWSIQAHSQNGISKIYIYDFSYGYGSTISNTKPKKFFIESRLNSINLFFGHQTLDSNSWNKSFRFPDYGWGIIANLLDENRILGNHFTIYYRINIPFSNKKKSGFYYATAIGPAWITKPFNPENHYYNKANGSNLNIYVYAGVLYRLYMSSGLKLKMGLSFQHISNGNMKLPNDGLNLVSLNTGLTFGKYRHKYALTKQSLQNRNSQPYKYIFSVNIATKQKQVSSKNFLIYNLTSEYILKQTQRRLFTFGIDFTVDNSLKANTYEYDVIKKNYSFYNAIFIGHSLLLNRFIIQTKLGNYVDYSGLIEEKIFYFLGFKYLMYNNLYFNFGLKARLSGGDYVGFGLSYFIKK